MANLFKDLTKNLKGERAMASIFFVAFFALLIGLWLGWEDAYSSYLGLKELETGLGLKPVNHDFTYIVLSVTPQVGQIIFGYAYATQKKRWQLGIALFFLVFDFVSDMQNRSNGLLVKTFLDYSWVDNWQALSGSALLTIGAFSLGSELFIILGFGILLETFDHAIDQIADLYTNFRISVIRAKTKIKGAYDKAHNLTPNPPAPHQAPPQAPQRQGGHHGR